VDKFLGRYSRY